MSEQPTTSTPADPTVEVPQPVQANPIATAPAQETSGTTVTGSLSDVESGAAQVATDVSGEVSQVEGAIKADPQVVSLAKEALAAFGHEAQEVEEFFAHLFHRGFTVVKTPQSTVEAPTAVQPSTDAAGQ